MRLRPNNQMAQTSLFFFFFLLFSYISTTTSNETRTKQPKFPAIFFFGDSTLDTGNNDYLPTIVKANHFPYGRDFAGGAATGRFSNGRLVSDLLCARLRIKSLSPPFMDPKLSDDDIRTGVNFASAGSGFDGATSALTKTISMASQLKMFRSYLARLRGIVAEEEAARIVASALMFISAGTNDFALNFYDLPTRRGEFNISEYQDFLLHKVQGYLKDIYDLGGRIFCIAGLPPIGCMPVQITASLTNSADRSCVEELNSDATVYNSKLQKLLHMMQQFLPGSKFAYINPNEIVMEVLNNHARYGFEETRRGCCGTGLIEVGPLCNKLTPVCENVSSYVFYDAIHPTERLNILVTDYIMKHVIPRLQ